MSQHRIITGVDLRSHGPGTGWLVLADSCKRRQPVTLRRYRSCVVGAAWLLWQRSWLTPLGQSRRRRCSAWNE